MATIEQAAVAYKAAVDTVAGKQAAIEDISAQITDLTAQRFALESQKSSAETEQQKALEALTKAASEGSA